MENIIYAEIYKITKKNVYHVKVHCNEITIAGIRVQDSINFRGSQLWVQMPSYKTGNNWHQYIEFKDQDGGKLQAEILKACRDVVNRYKDDPQSFDLNVTELMSDEEFNKSLQALPY